MARVQLEIADSTQRITFAAMLEADGHTVVYESADVLFTDSGQTARARAHKIPTIQLATASEIPEAARGMRAGVRGYIFVPFQPGEADAVIGQIMGTPSESVADSRPEGMRTLEEVEMEYIQSVLRNCKYNQARAARILGIGRNTLWRKLKKGKVEGGAGAASASGD